MILTAPLLLPARGSVPCVTIVELFLRDRRIGIEGADSHKRAKARLEVPAHVVEMRQISLSAAVNDVGVDYKFDEILVHVSCPGNVRVAGNLRAIPAPMG